MTTVSKPVFFEVSYKWRSCYTGKLTKSSKESILRSPQRWLVSLLLPSWSRPLSPFFFFEFSNGGVAIIAIIGGDEFFQSFLQGTRKRKQKRNRLYRVVKSLLNIQADCCTYVANGMIFPNFIISVTQNSLEIGLYTGCPINSTKPRYTPHGYTITDSSLP